MITCRFYVSNLLKIARNDKGLNKLEYIEDFSNEWKSEFRDLALVAYEIEGHADSAPYGEDLVCAATTALAYSCLTALDDILNIELKYLIYDGYVRVEVDKLDELDSQQIEKVNLLIESLFLGLRQINESYNKKYLSLHTEFYEARLGGQNNDED